MKKPLFLWFLLSPLISMAQLKYDANWTFGVKGGINFNRNQNPQILISNCNNIEANASISDSAGNLLLYLSLIPNSTMGTIRDKSHFIISNGSNILADPSASNGALFLTDPDDSNKLYLFYIGQDGQQCGYPVCYKVFYSVIVKRTSGNWEVTEKNNVLGNNIVEESIAAIRDADGTGWWILSHEQRKNFPDSSSNKFFVYHLTDTITTSVQPTPNHHRKLSSIVGDIVPFNNGTMFLEVVADDNVAYINRFDRCSGTITSFDSIKVNLAWEHLYSGAVTERYIYLSFWNVVNSLGTGGIYRYELVGSTIVGPVNIFSEQAQGYYQGQMELGPDGNIWVSHGYYGQDPILKNKYQKHLSVILYADSDSALYTPYYFYVGDSSENREGLPNFPNYNLGPEGVFFANAGKDTTLCSNTNTTGVPIGVPPVPNIIYTWQPATGLSATNVAQPTANPAQSTWYYLTATDTTATSCAVNTDSVYVEVRTCVGITETSALQAKLYPNPTNGVLTIELPASAKGYSFKLFNLLGQQIIDTKLAQEKTVLQLNYPTGIYLYQVTHNGQVQNGKLVVE
jgi:hypothetical protein